MRSVCSALLLFCLVFIFSVPAPGPASGATETGADRPDAARPLRVAVNMPYPPFCFSDASGAVTGFDVDLALAICARLERECDLKPMPVADIIPAFERNELDFAVAGLGVSEARRKVANFTGTYYRSLSIFIGREEEFSGLEPKKLEGRTACVRQGTLQEAYLREHYGDVINLVPMRTLEELFTAVQSGQADLAFVDGLAGYYFLKQERWEGLDTLGPPVAVSEDANQAKIAVAKNHPDLLEQLDAAIISLRANGEYSKINRRYFDFDIY